MISSVSEGSPNVLLEAMAAGVPVVATAVGGIPEIVRHQEQALLVPPRDPAAMAEAIDILLSNPEMQTSWRAAARTLAATIYSPQQRALWLVGLYRKIFETWQLQARKHQKGSTELCK